VCSAVCGGDGLLSSQRQYSFSKALDIRSANSSSCAQVFHRQTDDLRNEATGIVQVRAHDATVCTPRTDPVLRLPAQPRAARPSHRGALCTAESVATRADVALHDFFSLLFSASSDRTRFMSAGAMAAKCLRPA
jgi:hypothetical protein